MWGLHENSEYTENAMRNDIMRNTTESKSISGLLDNLRELIASGRQQALRGVDVIQVHTCWELGRHIVEFEQGGAGRAEWVSGTDVLT